ncbi:MAG TPA: hypothetical protein VN699_18100 [Pirellulales bacterium]|nr:hypothetical protein [Pirellulales bacterium]
MKVPQDIANLLAVCIRDLLWYRQRVTTFLDECDVPPGIMVEVNRMANEKTPTIKVIHHVLERLANQGDEGTQAARAMLTKMYYWNDLHSVAADRKDQAVASLKAFREGYDRFRAQREYFEEQMAQEKRMHAERAARGQMKGLDHSVLYGFRDEFDQIAMLPDKQERGNRLEALMNKVFDYYCEDSKGPVRRTGEQIDGLFKLDSHWHYVEVRWKDEKAIAADVSVLRDRAKSAFGGDTKALFISFNGFTSECLESLGNQSDERVILMDGFDLRCVLNCDIALDVLLGEKQAELVGHKRPFVGAAEFIARRAGQK